MPTEPSPIPTGSATTSLVIVRGNSGSGKSTIARLARTRYGRGCALVEQDYLRRIMLRERDVAGGNAAALIATNVRFALDAGYHVICEGILHNARYGDMLRELCRAHRGTTSVFYLDVSLPDTLRRHTERPQAADFTAEDMRGWYAAHDVLGIEGEHVLDEKTSLQDAVKLIGACLPHDASRINQGGISNAPDTDEGPVSEDQAV